MRKIVLAGSFLLLGGCAMHGGVRAPDSGMVVVAAPGRAEPRARALHVPPGHYPPPGQCRVWYEGVPPGHQPKPASCDALRRVPRGAFLLYSSKAWDTQYDWHGYDRRHPGEVPGVVLRIMATINR